MSELDWVDIANLKGPKGDEGPVNVGVESVSAAGDKLRFGFTDGRPAQDVALPLATSNSAGLLDGPDKAKLDGITVDNSAGKRIFVGDIMIHGETGRRDIRTLLHPEWVLSTTGGTLEIMREGHTVTLVARIMRSETSPAVDVAVSNRPILSTPSSDLPAGFAPDLGYVPYAFAGYKTGESGGVLAFTAESGRRALQVRGASGTWRPGDEIKVQTSWRTNQPWPTILPGTPA